jgi:hypothetical protein
MAGMTAQAKPAQASRWAVDSRRLRGRLTWEAERIWRDLGWGGAAGLLCFVLALFGLWQTRQLVQKSQSLAMQLRAAQSNALANPVNEIPQADTAQQIAAFYAYLPPHDAIPDQLKRLFTLAQKSGITLTQAQYKPQPETNGEFLRYQIVLPLRASYQNIQLFILNALRELPTLTLESVTFKREKIESGEVEARIQYVLLTKKPLVKGFER